MKSCTNYATPYNSNHSSVIPLLKHLCQNSNQKFILIRAIIWSFSHWFKKRSFSKKQPRFGLKLVIVFTANKFHAGILKCSIFSYSYPCSKQNIKVVIFYVAEMDTIQNKSLLQFNNWFFLRWAFLEFHNYRGNNPKYSSNLVAFQDNLHKCGIRRGLSSRMSPSKINITLYGGEITEFCKQN